MICGGVASEFLISSEVLTNHIAHHVFGFLKWVHSKDTADATPSDNAYTRLKPLVTSLFHPLIPWLVIWEEDPIDLCVPLQRASLAAKQRNALSYWLAVV
jgi:hypothetical protein